MSHMREVARLLGVEWEDDKSESERFEVEGSEYNYYFNNDCLRVKGSATPKQIMLVDLLNGNYKIKKQPWKPKQAENYYIPNPCNTSNYSECYNYDNDLTDFQLGKNLVCKTRTEAIAKAEHMLKSLKTFEWEGDGE